MDKLVDFGEAVDAKEMVDLVLVLNCCPIYSKDRQKPRRRRNSRCADLGHGPLYDPIFAMKDAHVADETGTQAETIRFWCSSIRSKKKGYPCELRASGQGRLRDTIRDRPTFKAGRDSSRSMARLNSFSCQPRSTRASRRSESTAPAQSRAAPPTSTPSSAPQPIGVPHRYGLRRLRSCLPKIRHASRREVGSGMCRSSLMTRPGTTSWRRGLGRPSAPPLADKAEDPDPGRARYARQLGPTAARRRSCSACSPEMMTRSCA